MPLVPISRPYVLIANNSDDHRRWQKHTLDNIDRINRKFAIVEAELTSGGELGVENPFGERLPTGFTPIYAEDDNGNPLIVAGSSMNTLRTDGQIGLTVDYASAEPLSGSGAVGEYYSAAVTQASAVALTSTVTKTITSITLPAGDWQVDGLFCFTGGAITGTVSQVHIATAPDNVTGSVLGDSWVISPTIPTAAADTTIAIPGNRRSLSVSTSIYLNATMAFTAGTAKAYGRISARRAAVQLQTVSGTVTGVLWGPA